MEYNLPHEKFEVYKPFEGKDIEQMSLLLSEGRVPLWTSRFMRRRIDYSEKLPDLDEYIDTSDLIAYDRKDRSDNVKFILTVDNQGRITEIGRKALELINPKARLTSDYAIELGEQYDEFQGDGVITIPENQLGKLEENLTEDEILSSKTWRILARHPDEVSREFAEDKNLLKEYAQWVAKKTADEKNMAVDYDSVREIAKLRALCVYGLEDWSWLYGRISLDDDDGRLVGLAPEALSARSIEEKVRSALERKEEFEYQGTIYVPIKDKKINSER